MVMSISTGCEKGAAPEGHEHSLDWIARVGPQDHEAARCQLLLGHHGQHLAQGLQASRSPGCHTPTIRQALP